MIRALRLLRHAWRLAEAEYALHRLTLELEALGVEHDDDAPACTACDLELPLVERIRSARSAYLALRGPR